MSSGAVTVEEADDLYRGGHWTKAQMTAMSIASGEVKTSKKIMNDTAKKEQR